MNILSNYDKNYTGVISIDGEKMNKVDYLDMPVAYAMDQPIFFTHDILKNFIGMLYYQIDIGMW